MWVVNAAVFLFGVCFLSLLFTFRHILGNAAAALAARAHKVLAVLRKHVDGSLKAAR